MKALFSVLLILVTLIVHAQPANVREKHFNIDDKLALDGYDPVSYFKGKPLEGSKKFAYTYNGVIYFFASQGNLQEFKLKPEMYEPAYGGWCAFAMGETGEKVKVDPETYKIHEGRLYLFYNFWGNNTLKSWNKNESGLRTAADKNWAKTIKQ